MSDSTVVSFLGHKERLQAKHVKESASNYVAEYSITVQVTNNNKVHAKFLTHEDTHVSEEEQARHLVEIAKVLLSGIDRPASESLKKVEEALRQRSQKYCPPEDEIPL